MIFQWSFVEPAQCANSGVVDPNIDAPEFIHRSVRKFLDLSRVTHVRLYRQSFYPKLVTLTSQIFQKPATPRGQHQVRPRSSKLQSHTLTESTRCTSYDDNTIPQISHENLTDFF